MSRAIRGTGASGAYLLINGHPGWLSAGGPPGRLPKKLKPLMAVGLATESGVRDERGQ